MNLARHRLHRVFQLYKCGGSIGGETGRTQRRWLRMYFYYAKKDEE